MTDAVRRLYWDTGVFVCLLNAKSEKSRRDIAVDILRHAKNGRVVICTSVFTIIEVLRPKDVKWPAPLTADQIREIEGMFKWPWLRKYQVHEPLALKAAKLARDTGLKPADALHAATAIYAGADALQKWDRDFSKVQHLIQIEEPNYIDQLPLDLSQD